jgi:hypothetical protein
MDCGYAVLSFLARYQNKRQTAPRQGAIDSPGKLVNPSSLYLAQLCERLGPQTLAKMGDLLAQTAA